MLLLTVQEWIGPGRDMVEDRHLWPEKISTKAFATRLELERAINVLADYEDRYNRANRLAVNFTLIGIQTIEDISDGALECVRVELVENLEKKRFE